MELEEGRREEEAGCVERGGFPSEMLLHWHDARGVTLQDTNRIHRHRFRLMISAGFVLLLNRCALKRVPLGKGFLRILGSSMLVA